MSLPPIKSIDSTIPDGGASQDVNNGSNNTNHVTTDNGAGNDANGANGGGSKSGATGASAGVNNTTAGPNSTIGAGNYQDPKNGNLSQINNQADDPYRYSQQQNQSHQQQQMPGTQQYPYYAYQPVYSQPQQQSQPAGQSQQTQQAQQYQGQYPAYYQSSAGSAVGSTTAAASSQQVSSSSYPDYSNYSRMNYVQTYNPAVYGQNVVGGVPATGSINGATAGAQTTPSQMTNVTASGIGQVQPVGSRPRVTTTMWEDEKTLCYQVDANNVSVVRRADNNMINGTKLLNVAHMTRGRRDGILKSEKVRDVVKIGSMHLKGVWIPFERALAMAQREGIVDLLYPLFVRDIKQVIQQGSTTQPQQNPPAWGYQQQTAATGAATGTQALTQSNGATSSVSSAPGTATQIKQSNSPYMTPSSLNSGSNLDSKASGAQSVQPSTQTYQQPQTQQPGQGAQSQQQGLPQHVQQQNYYSYAYYPPYQYGYGYGASSGLPQGSTGSGASAVAGSNAGTNAAAASQYQYPQYSYGYMPQYQSSQYDDQKEKWVVPVLILALLWWCPRILSSLVKHLLYC